MGLQKTQVVNAQPIIPHNTFDATNASQRVSLASIKGEQQLKILLLTIFYYVGLIYRQWLKSMNMTPNAKAQTTKG